VAEEYVLIAFLRNGKMIHGNGIVIMNTLKFWHGLKNVWLISNEQRKKKQHFGQGVTNKKGSDASLPFLLMR
jgi:hypothetical protein